MIESEYKSDRGRFEEEISRRNITRLLHFTPTINLFSIFEQGAILSRDQLSELSLEYPDLYLNDFVEINDRLRLDKMKDHINISIQRPNHWLFKRFRESCRNWCDSWCVISLKPQILYLSDTLFSVGNAASAYSRNHGIGGTFNHFISLFNENLAAGNIYNQRVLTRCDLKDCYPTDAQAEVLVKGRIPVSEIQEVFFETSEESISAKGAISVLCSVSIPPFIINKTVFQQRGV